ECLDGERPDGVWFATTTPPYLEKQAAAILAAAIDAPRTARTSDVAASMRGFADALAAAADAVAAGSVRRARVTAGDVRQAAPESAEEPVFGDGGGALLREPGGEGAELLAIASVNDTTLTTWRRPT